MQHIHDCNGEGLVDYPNNVDCKDVNVWMHDSGMACTHDYSCTVCRKESAILQLSIGIMQPCWTCQDLGYVLVKKKESKFNELLKRWF